MVQNQPKQSRTQRLGNVMNFVRVVKTYLAKYQWTQKDLAVAADMTEAMISRMFRDQNGRGDTFDLTPVMVMKIACALKVGTEGYMKLMEAAYPEFVNALHSKERTMILNINLSEKGKPPLKCRYRCPTGQRYFCAYHCTKMQEASASRMQAYINDILAL